MTRYASMFERCAAQERGAIVPFVMLGDPTPSSCEAIIEALIADGYTILPVSQMLLPGDTHIDPNGRQCPANADAGT